MLDFSLEGIAGPAKEMPREDLALTRFGNVNEFGVVTLRWDGLRPGAYRFQALAKGTDTVLASLPNVPVSGRSAANPATLDLSEALFFYRLSITGPDLSLIHI